jgi:hypothetical protein
LQRCGQCGMNIKYGCNINNLWSGTIF